MADLSRSSSFSLSGCAAGAKAIAIAVVLGVCTILAVALGWFYTAVLFEPPSVAGWIAFAALAATLAVSPTTTSTSSIASAAAPDTR